MASYNETNILLTVVFRIRNADCLFVCDIVNFRTQTGGDILTTKLAVIKFCSCTEHYKSIHLFTEY